MRIGLFSIVTEMSGPLRNRRSVTPLPISQRPENEKICGCRIGTPVVMRATSTPASRSCCAKASRKSLGSLRRRASVISHRITGWTCSAVATGGTTDGSDFCGDPALQRGTGGLAVLCCDVACDHADGGREHRRIVGEAEDRQHVRQEI